MEETLKKGAKLQTEETKAVITVLGEDRVGIVASISTLMAEKSINIEDITQKILKGNIFAMLMLIDMKKAKVDYAELRKLLKIKEEELGMKIMVQDLKLFNYMHRI